MLDRIRRAWGELRGSSPVISLRAALDDAAPTVAGFDVNPESAMRQTAVFACVRVLSEGIAGLPFHVYRRDGQTRQRATEHPVYRLVHGSPNAMQTAFGFRQQLMVNLLLSGNAYVEIARNGQGVATALWPMRPESVTVRSRDGVIEYTVFSAGKQTTLRAEDVIHLKGLSSDGILGLSPIQAARESIALSLAAESFGAAFFGSGSQLGGYFEYPGTLSDEAAGRFLDSWKRRYAGSRGWQQMAVLESGMKFTPLTVNNQDAQFLDTRRFGVEDICRIYRVPPHMVAELSKANYSNVDAMDRAFVSHSLAPWAANIEQAFTARLLGPREQATLFCEFDLNGAMRGDPEARMRQYVAGIQNGIYSPNECRKFENLNPRDGGDEFLRPVNMAISSGANNEASTVPATEPKPAL